MPRPFTICCLLTLAATCGLTSGCYDSKSLVDEVRNQAIRTRLDEVSIGYFRTTLPRWAIHDSPMEIEVDLFGTAVRHKISEIEAAIAQHDHRVRQAVVVAIRHTTAEEIADPKLTSFRQRLLTVVNAEIADTPIDSLGFRTVRFIPL